MWHISWFVTNMGICQFFMRQSTRPTEEQLQKALAVFLESWTLGSDDPLVQKQAGQVKEDFEKRRVTLLEETQPNLWI